MDILENELYEEAEDQNSGGRRGERELLMLNAKGLLQSRQQPSRM